MHFVQPPRIPYVVRDRQQSSIRQDATSSDGRDEMEVMLDISVCHLIVVEPLKIADVGISIRLVMELPRRQFFPRSVPDNFPKSVLSRKTSLVLLGNVVYHPKVQDNQHITPLDLRWPKAPIILQRERVQMQLYPLHRQKVKRNVHQGQRTLKQLGTSPSYPRTRRLHRTKHLCTSRSLADELCGMQGLTRASFIIEFLKHSTLPFGVIRSYTTRVLSRPDLMNSVLFDFTRQAWQLLRCPLLCPPPLESIAIHRHILLPLPLALVGKECLYPEVRRRSMAAGK
jgi:hypothetical protein